MTSLAKTTLETSRPAKRAKVADAEAGAAIPELEGIRQSETQLTYLQAQLAATEALYSAYEVRFLIFILREGQH